MNKEKIRKIQLYEIGLKSPSFIAIKVSTWSCDALQGDACSYADISHQRWSMQASCVERVPDWI